MIQRCVAKPLAAGEVETQPGVYRVGCCGRTGAVHGSETCSVRVTGQRRQTLGAA